MVHCGRRLYGSMYDLLKPALYGMRQKAIRQTRYGSEEPTLPSQPEFQVNTFDNVLARKM